MSHSPSMQFTLTTPLVTEVIPQPVGWKDTIMKLDRDERFGSLIEHYDAPLTFYGRGLRILKDAEALEGITAKPELKIELRYDPDAAWETLTNGIVDIQGLDEMSFGKTVYKTKFPILRNDLWQKLLNNLDTPVNIKSTTDLAGNAVTAMQNKTLQLPSQKIRYRSSLKGNQDATIQYVIPNNQFGQFVFPQVILDELRTRFTLGGSETNPVRPVNFLTAEYAGDYLFNITLYFYTGPFIGSSSLPANIKFRLQVNNDAVIELTKTDESSGIDAWSKYTYNSTIVLKEGDQVRLYIENLTSVSQTINWFAGVIKTSELIITADTTYTDSTAEAFHLHDVGKGILDRITTKDRFYSGYLGHTSFTAKTYGAIGDGFRYMLLNGLGLRGFTLAQKPYSESFNDWYNSIDAILNLGCGYDTISGTEYIQVEKKEYFFDQISAPSATFYNVELHRSYDKSFIFKKVEIGYSKGQAEEAGIIDDPHMKVTYGTQKFERVGSNVSKLSAYIAAASTIELGRRKKIETGKDWRYDNDTFIISINPAEVSAGVFKPELNENFSSLANLVSSTTKYNHRLWPVFNFLRWINVFRGALQKYQDSYFKFLEGEGNFDAEGNMAVASEDLITTGQVISQKQNILVGIDTDRGETIHSDELYSCTVPLTWTQYKSIRDNRKKAIAIARDSNWEWESGDVVEWYSGDDITLQGALFFIKTLSWKLIDSVADLLVWRQPSSTIEPTSSNDILLLETGDPMLLESGSTILLEN